MGIQGFGVFLRKKCPQVYRRVDDLSYFAKSRIAIDMEHKIYQMFYRNGGNSASIMNDVESFCRMLDKYSITSYFVFDGNTKGLKNAAHAKRKNEQTRKMERHDELEEEIENLKSECKSKGIDPDSVVLDRSTGLVVKKRRIDILPDSDRLISTVCETDKHTDLEEEIAKLESKLAHKKARYENSSVQILKPSRELFTQVKEYLENTASIGKDKVITANDDAEREIALMTINKRVDYAISADYDTLAFGSPNLVVDFMDRQKMAILHLDDVLENMSIDMNQFIDFSILCGCDFCGKVPGIGPNRALDIIKRYRTIEEAYTPKLVERFKNHEDKIKFDYEFARKRFLHKDMEAITE